MRRGIVTIVAITMVLGQVSNGYAAGGAVQMQAMSMQADCPDSAAMNSVEPHHMDPCCENGRSPDGVADGTGPCEQTCVTVCVGAMTALLDSLAPVREAPVGTAGPQPVPLSLTPHPVDFITPPPRA